MWMMVVVPLPESWCVKVLVLVSDVVVVTIDVVAVEAVVVELVLV
jgi:hypothetical protein